MMLSCSICLLPVIHVSTVFISLKAILTCVRAQVHGELAGVAAGVGADLTLERPLVVVHAQVFLQAAAVCGGVRAVLALVWLFPRVRATVQVQLVPPAEALVAQLTLERPVTWTRTAFLPAFVETRRQCKRL